MERRLTSPACPRILTNTQLGCITSFRGCSSDQGLQSWNRGADAIATMYASRAMTVAAGFVALVALAAVVGAWAISTSDRLACRLCATL